MDAVRAVRALRRDTSPRDAQRRARGRAVAALVANNLSNGYFLLFFAPVVPVFAMWEMARRGLLRDLRSWMSDSASTAAGVAACTVPFLLPYVWLRQATGEHRAIDEVAWFSADVYAYVTAEYNLSLFGRWLRTFPRAEGDLFPGFTPLLLAAIAVAVGPAASAGRGLAPRAASSRPLPATWGASCRVAVVGGFALAAIYGAVLLVVVAGYGGRFRLGRLDLRINSVTTAVALLGVSAVVLSRARRASGRCVARGWRSPSCSSWC